MILPLGKDLTCVIHVKYPALMEYSVMKLDALKLGKTKLGNVNGVVRSSSQKNTRKIVAVIHVL